MHHSFDLIPFLTFAVVTSITPGPNNISSMAFCLSSGYRNTLPYIIGIAFGTFIIFLLCGLLSFGLAHFLPEITTYLKYIGASYIVYLAYKTSQLNVDERSEHNAKARFHDGALLQLVNPKAIFYGMTIYTTFFQSFNKQPLYLGLSALGLAVFTFLIVSIWGLFGSALRHYLKNPFIKRMFIGIMVAGLIYAALNILLT